MNKLSSKMLLAALLLSAGAFGCSSNTTAATTTTPETFTDVYTTILGPTCSGCHAAAGPDKFLDMGTQAAAYASLVGVKAAGPACGSVAGETRVVAGNAAGSLLYDKISHATPACGKQMPYGGTPLTADKVEKILNWIDQGALNN